MLNSNPSWCPSCILSSQEGAPIMQKVYKNTRATDSEPIDIVALEAIMTESAFGHEYTLMNLSDLLSFSRQQVLMTELDDYKKNYFWARHQLKQINPTKLVQIEAELQLQKMILIDQSRTIH